jgi:hypothetical protein
MNDWGFKIRVFFSTLVMTLAGILPATGCTRGCVGSCFQCAGLGGLMAIVVTIAAAKIERGSKG